MVSLDAERSRLAAALKRDPCNPELIEESRRLHARTNSWYDDTMEARKRQLREALEKLQISMGIPGRALLAAFVAIGRAARAAEVAFVEAAGFAHGGIQESPPGRARGGHARPWEDRRGRFHPARVRGTR